MSWVRQRWDVRGGALVMLGIKLRDTCAILDKPLREISGPNDPYHIVAIKRRNETIIPGGNETLQREDLAYFMTTKEYIPYVRKFTGKEHYVDVKKCYDNGWWTHSRALCKKLCLNIWILRLLKTASTDVNILMKYSTNLYLLSMVMDEIPTYS